MKKMLLLVLLAMLGSVPLYALPPVIFYSDLTSGPRTGGRDDRGAFVALFGRNFGTARSGSFVSIGGGRADNYPVWTDTKVTFQLGVGANTGDVTVTTREGTSNGVRFTVRPGNIYFVDDTSPGEPGSGTFADPWRSPRSYFLSMKPGDICYFRAGAYPGRYGSQSRPYNVSFHDTGNPGGGLNNEIAWVGYPGEAALFRADDGGAFEFKDGARYYVVSGLHVYSRGDGRGAFRLFSDNNAVVNCTIEGIKTLSYGMFEVTATEGTRIWGNECFGATSGNKLDHILYCQQGADNVDFGWNYVHHNDLGPGPVISLNEDGGHRTGAVYRNIRVHDNFIDCRHSSTALRAIGVADAAPGGSLYIYNNIIVEGGGDADYNHCVYVNACSVYLYNNTFYRTRGNGGYAVHVNDVADDWHPETVEIKNNIFLNQADCGYVGIASRRSRVTVSNNAYYGGRGGFPDGDPSPVGGAPMFVDGSSLNFHLRSGSPCIDAGLNTADTAPRDYDGAKRAPGRIDLGAFEYLPPRPSASGP